MLKRSSIFAAFLAPLMMAAPFIGASEEPASRPAIEGELMNETCPFTGKDAVSGKFVEYADEIKGVYARVYFCCENCQGNASKMDQAALKPVYAKAYLADIGDYGKASLILENARCPVTGNPVDGSTTLNYNGTQINLCCPGCDQPVIDEPDKYLHNLNNDIDAARAAKESEAKSQD